MERINQVYIEELDEKPICADCIYCKALDLLLTLDDGLNGYCEFHSSKINQTEEICQEYIENYEQ